MPENPTPEQRAQRILQGFNAELHDGNPMWLYKNIQMEIEDAIAKTVVLKSSPITREQIRTILEGCRETFDITFAGLTTSGIDLLTGILSGELNAAAKPEKPRHAVGVSVLLVESGNILLGRRGPDTGAAQGWLSTPGGRLEIKESVLQCAQRELAEETGVGVSLENLKVIGFRKHDRFGQDYIMFYVLATSHVGQIHNVEGPSKCEGWQWYSAALATMTTDVTEPKDILYEAFAEAERQKL